MPHQIPYTYQFDRNSCVAGTEPLIFHCHHYNTYLQMAIEDAKSYIDVYPILIDSAHEIAYDLFHTFFSSNDLSTEERKLCVESFYQVHGFGILPLGSVNKEGGTVETHSEHYSVGWMSKFGLRKSEEPAVSFFCRGFLAGATEAIFDLPFGSMAFDQTHCLTKGDAFCRFTGSLTYTSKKYSPSPRLGAYQTFSYTQPKDSGVNYLAIRDALVSMPIAGSETEGLIDAFGVLLTRHFANYYCLISYKLLKQMEEKFGQDGVFIARDLLIEAGHVCAFNTFGGVMLSNEWNALIKPMLTTSEDWLHGMVACVNAFGWGWWSVDELIPGKTLKMSIQSGYESNSFLGTHSDSTYSVSYLATGGIAGLMNLIYNGDIRSTPELNTEYYNQIHKSSQFFIANQKECRAMGASKDSFVAQLLSEATS